MGDGAVSTEADRAALPPCPFCGGHPSIAKHFKDEAFRLTHRCPAVGAILLDWAPREHLIARWSRRARAEATDEAIRAALDQAFDVVRNTADIFAEWSIVPNVRRFREELERQGLAMVRVGT